MRKGLAMRFERVVVTGGAGFLGSYVCEELVFSGVSVVCVDDLSTGRLSNVDTVAEHPRFHFQHADITEPLRVPGPVDAVLHLACPASPADYLREPVRTMRTGSLGTLHALELAKAHRSRFLLASTSEVYGDPLRHPQTEDYWGNVNPVGPRSVYDESKRFSEALTTAYRGQYGLRASIARIFNSYGPRMRPDDGRMIPTFIRQGLAGEPITVFGDGAQTRSLCYVSDTVRGLITLARSGIPGPVNIGSPEEHPVSRIAERVRELTGSSAPVVHEQAMTDDPRRRCPDIAVAARELGWAPEVSLTEGLRRTVDHFAAASFAHRAAG
ncbi:SDR family oxidoreductase [Crossiella sp. CA-258035]|uniref:UDP-glucuronic acid decarboxylase family protein n=1 Tax=Crossiella sp. CA-258035 TaxID=2981138 RepID=UPI0024BC493C|nr:UDP-glucuronic acid decarboxylase family protein [Crossiella sp. CA-258035]WHT15940.1 SDR family oxidoreductase [Crossiella sp. CA-258035]